MGKALEELEFGQLSKFVNYLAGCPEKDGVYTLWFEKEFLYVGISRVDPGKTSNSNACGVRGRLGAYLKGSLTTDFCVSLFLRYIVPELTEEEREELRDGRIDKRKMSERVRKFVQDYITYRVWQADGVNSPDKVESHIRTKGLTCGKPLFNPR